MSAQDELLEKWNNDLTRMSLLVIVFTFFNTLTTINSDI